MGFSKARRRERGSPGYWYGGLYSPPFAPVPLVHEVREGVANHNVADHAHFVGKLEEITNALGGLLRKVNGGVHHMTLE